MKKQNDKAMMTIPEVTEFLRISRQYLHTLTKEGKLPSYKLGRRVLYKRTEVEEYLEQNKQ